MIVKWIGLIMMLCGSFGLGYSFYRDLQLRYEAMMYMSKIMEIAEQELSSLHSTLPQLFFSLSKKVRSPYAEAFLRIYRRCEEEREVTFYEAWEEEIQQLALQCNMTKRDAAIVAKLFSITQNGDLQTQMNALHLARKTMDDECSALRTQKDAKGKVALCLGAAGGMAMFILFV